MCLSSIEVTTTDTDTDTDTNTNTNTNTETGVQLFHRIPEVKTSQMCQCFKLIQEIPVKIGTI